MEEDDRNPYGIMEEDDRNPYGITDLGAQLWPCKNCGKISILSLSLCKDCRPIDYIFMGTYGRK